MQLDRILANIVVGSCPRSLDDITLLKTDFGVTAVLSLQTDDDLRYWGLDWPHLENAYRAAGIIVRRAPVRDFDLASLRENLPRCVDELRALIQAGHAVYVHCNAGINRSPTTVIAYLHWVEGLELGEAVWRVTSQHACDPYVSAILEANSPGRGRA